MCGFLGRVNLSADRSASRPLRRGLPWLGRRGPDGHRQWSSGDDTVEFLHARLGIVDRTSAADQPLTSDDSQTCIMFVGEIYNYRELRARYRDYPYRTESDTEVILAAYVKDGFKALDALRGMFTIAIADQRSRRVLLVRDSVGKKPLFVARWGDAVYFGSSIVPMRATCGAAIEIEAGADFDYWQWGFLPPIRTALQACRPVPAGCIVQIDIESGTVSEHPLRPAAADAPAATLAEAEAEINVLLRQAVERRLDNNPSPAILLSGGIGSTVVADVTARHCRQHGRKLCVLTLGSAVPLTNDEFYARYAAWKLGLPLEIIRFARKPIEDHVATALEHQDEPLGMISFLPLYLLVTAAAQHCRILIGGDGGDEVFLGYGQPQDWIASGGLKFRGRHMGQPAPPPWMSAYGWRALTTDLLGHRFPKIDRASAEQAVELRAPLLDWDLVAFARRLRPDIMFAGRLTKALLKRRLSNWPEWFVDRKKSGLALNPRGIWVLRNFEGLRDMVTVETVERFNPLLPARLRRPPAQWTRRDIMLHFECAWSLLAWSGFERRLRHAEAP
jgi:asparagine synthase (glutamine-hydrolysing)